MSQRICGGREERRGEGFGQDAELMMATCEAQQAPSSQTPRGLARATRVTPSPMPHVPAPHTPRVKTHSTPTVEKVMPKALAGVRSRRRPAVNIRPVAECCFHSGRRRALLECRTQALGGPCVGLLVVLSRRGPEGPQMRSPRAEPPPPRSQLQAARWMPGAGRRPPWLAAIKPPGRKWSRVGGMDMIEGMCAVVVLGVVVLGGEVWRLEECRLEQPFLRMVEAA